MITKKLALFWRALATILAILFISFPGSSATWFNGLPLSPYEALALFTILVIIWAAPWPAQRRQRLFLITTLSTLVIWQLIGAATLPNGWSVCLQRELQQEKLTTRCEPSAEFRSGERSFIYPNINFSGQNFPLYFINEIAFNYTSEDDPDRNRLPYTFIASAFFEPKQPTDIIATTNTPNTIISINGHEQEVPFDEELRLTLNANSVSLIELSFTATHSTSNAIQITTTAQPFYMQSGTSLPSSFYTLFYQIIFSLLLTILSLLLALTILSALFALSSRSRTRLLYASTLLIISVLAPTLSAALFTIALLGFALTYITTRQSDQTKLLPIILVFLAILSFTYTSSTQPYDQLHVLEGGDDTLTHEHYARLTLKADSFRDYLTSDQPNVFYFQPLYRYLLGFTHQILGEPLWAAAFIQTYLLSLMVLYSSKVIHNTAGTIGAGLFGILFFASQAIPETTYLKLAQTTYQEAIGSPLFFIAVLFTINAWLQRDLRHRTQLITGLLWGLTISIRTNLAPALLALFIYAVALAITSPSKKHLIKSAFSLIGGLALFPLLVITRNIIIAGEPAFLTTSLHPNLLDPFRALFPNIGGASDLSFFTVITTLLTNYQGRLFELISILWSNIHTNYIGKTLTPQIGWILILIMSIYGLIRKSMRAKTATVILLLIAIMPAIFGCFFLHREIAARSHNIYFLILAIPLLLGLIFPIKNFLSTDKQSRKKPPHSSRDGAPTRFT